MTDSVAWNETLIVHRLVPGEVLTSTVLQFKIYASSEFGQTLGRSQLVGRLRLLEKSYLSTTDSSVSGFEVSFPLAKNQYLSLLLRMRSVETPQPISSTADSLEVHRRSLLVCGANLGLVASLM
jgi:hypothetical protein